MNANVTINEAAVLADVSKNIVEKSIETKIVKLTKKHPHRMVDAESVAFLHLVNHSKFLSKSPISFRVFLRSLLRENRVHKNTFLTFEEGLSLDLSKRFYPCLDAVSAYTENREKFIDSNPDIFGGVPIIKGTRLSVYAIKDRVADGDTVSDLLDDYPYVSKDEFETAIEYAKTHPLRGRPNRAGKPWLKS